MLRFWTLRKFDATLLDALIATRVGQMTLQPSPQNLHRAWRELHSLPGMDLAVKFEAGH